MKNKKKHEEPKNLGEKKVRDEKGRFIKGVVTNPKGKPPGTKNYLTLLEEALEKEAERTGISYWDKLAQWSFRNPTVAISVLKKYIPDKSSTEITGAEDKPITINLVRVKTREDVENLKDD